VCKIHEGYHYTSAKIRSIPLSETVTQRVVLMRVFRKTHAFVTLTQKDKRSFAKDPTIKYGYSLARIIIGKIGHKSNEITTFAGTFGR
jgi:calpain-15